MNKSYVYRHICLSNNEIFYIGIGTHTRNNNYIRAHSVNNRNKIWHAYIKKHGEYKVEILHDEISREKACEIETELIKEFGRIVDNSGRLCNISFGGEKTFYGMIRTAEHCKKISESRKGQSITNEAKQKMRDAKLGISRSIESKEKQSKTHTGFIHSEETKMKMSKAKKGTQHAKGRIWKAESRELLAMHNRIPVFCINNNKKYPSAKDAAKDLGIQDCHIGSVCKGNRNSTHGYKFKYAS